MGVRENGSVWQWSSGSVWRIGVGHVSVFVVVVVVVVEWV